MSENKKPYSLQRQKMQFVSFYILLLTLVWRLIDLFDEAINGATKMSLGKWGLEGYDALLAQSVIIGILLQLVFQMRKSHISRDPGQ